MLKTASFQLKKLVITIKQKSLIAIDTRKYIIYTYRNMFFLFHWWRIRTHECDTRKMTKKDKSVLSPILQEIF